MAHRLELLGGWPDTIGAKPTEVFDAVRQIAREWNEHMAAVKVPFWAIQHGDLHPGNVMVNGGQLSFIDFARLGPWPVGYDICRLATLSRLILPHHEDEEDHLINHIGTWACETFATFDEAHHLEVCPSANRSDAAFAAFASSYGEDERAALHRTYQFCTLADLLRMISYSTFSPFKRIWIAVACWQLGCKLGFLNPIKE